MVVKTQSSHGERTRWCGVALCGATYVRDVIRAGGPLSFSNPPHLLLTIKIANTTLSQYQIHTHQMAPPSSSIIQETAEKEPSEVLFFFFIDV